MVLDMSWCIILKKCGFGWSDGPVIMALNASGSVYSFHFFFFSWWAATKKAPRAPYEQGRGVNSSLTGRESSEAILNSALTTCIRVCKWFLYNVDPCTWIHTSILFLSNTHILFLRKLWHTFASVLLIFQRDLKWVSQSMTLQSC